MRVCFPDHEVLHVSVPAVLHKVNLSDVHSCVICVARGLSWNSPNVCMWLNVWLVMVDGFKERLVGSLERILLSLSRSIPIHSLGLWFFSPVIGWSLISKVCPIPTSLNMVISLLLVFGLMLYKTVILLPSNALLANHLRKLVHVFHSQQKYTPCLCVRLTLR